ncbi:MAG: L-idonate 5-dehydrogenase [Solirubrobacteraceae bacterium]
MTSNVAVQAIVAHGADDLRLESVPVGDPLPGEVEVSLAVGGICGSDLHYFHRGGVGDFMIREPLVLGHEIAGTVTRLGPEVSWLTVGTRVVVNPSRPCGRCSACMEGRRNLCANGTFLGSAARMPHTQGGFRERMVVAAEQCIVLPERLAFEDAVFAEPLSVALHAVGRAGSLLMRNVLITGAGPIGVLIALVAHHAGAASITVTDVVDAPLEVASAVGATATVNVAGEHEAVDGVDVAFEASGAPAALQTCVDWLKPGGRLVLVGLMPPGTVPAAANKLVSRELAVVGSFRFVGSEFDSAVGALADGLDVSPLLSARFAFNDPAAAFAVASRRESAMKVQIVRDDL